MKLLYHIFADTGIESEMLAYYGKVIRVGLNPTRNYYDEVLQADANYIPLDKKADLAFLQPECSKWSPLAGYNGPNQIELARYIGETYAKDYIIENVPQNDEIRQDVRLYGSQFGLPFAYSRVFECSFDLDNPPKPKDIDRNISVRSSHVKPKSWWQKKKGYMTRRKRKDKVVKEGIPANYVIWLMEQYLKHE